MRRAHVDAVSPLFTGRAEDDRVFLPLSSTGASGVPGLNDEVVAESRFVIAKPEAYLFAGAQRDGRVLLRLPIHVERHVADHDLDVTNRILPAGRRQHGQQRQANAATPTTSPAMMVRFRARIVIPATSP